MCGALKNVFFGLFWPVQNANHLTPFRLVSVQVQCLNFALRSKRARHCDIRLSMSLHSILDSWTYLKDGISRQRTTR